MQSKALISSSASSNVTSNTSTNLSSELQFAERSFIERLIANRFNQIVATQTWSDPETDLLALQLKPGATIVTACSGGCNALAYLSAHPAMVYTVHDTAAQLAMLEIKAKSIQHLPDYEAVLNFLGKANHADNLKRYQRHIRSNLSETASQYWQQRSLSGRPRYFVFSQNAYQHSPLGRLILCLHKLIKWQGIELTALLQTKNKAEQIRFFETQLSPVFETSLFKIMSNQTLMLNALGLSFSQIAKIKNEAPDGIHHFIKQKIYQLLANFELAQNSFAQLFFAGEYDCNTQTALPLYLQRKVFSVLRQNAHRITSEKTSMRNFLSQQADASIDAFVLNDLQDRLSDGEIKALWTEIHRTAAPKAKILLRSITSKNNLEQQVNYRILNQWHTDPTQNQQLQQSDRSAIYGGIYLYTKI